MKKIVIDDAVAYAQPMFETLGQVVCLPGKEITAKNLKNADALIVRSRTQVNADLLENTSVKFVGSTVVGLDHIDQTYLQQRNIHFYSAQGCNANSVSEYIITNLINIAEQQQFELAEKSIGIIGVGHVGKLVEAKAKILGMRVLANDPPRAAQEGNQNFVSLDTALSADIITFHTPLTFNGQYKTHHLLNKDNFHLVKPDAILVNAARGGIIDENAWIKKSTKSNIIDCWEDEPYISEPLYKLADIATPHIAGHALDAKIKGSLMVYKALSEFWGASSTNDWQAELPPSPKPMTAISNNNLQQTLYQLLQHCYQPKNDDLAIRASDINMVHKKFEYYRRHYPIHREWTEHSCHITTNPETNKQLSQLGFKMIRP